jgi:hypothetical protein
MLSQVDKLRATAEECRALAATVKSPEIREQLLDVSDQFERLARHREFVEMASPQRSGRAPGC